ncbi:hypothetical protein BGZ68_007404 [Mortierella alpina]|nr:hypothetical protein BGZ68_007404 [Mortierella alpina]
MAQRQASPPELSSSAQSSVSPTPRASLASPTSSSAASIPHSQTLRTQLQGRRGHSTSEPRASKSYASPEVEAALEHWLSELPHHHAPKRPAQEQPPFVCDRKTADLPLHLTHNMDHARTSVNTKALTSYSTPPPRARSPQESTPPLDALHLDHSMAARMLIALNQQGDSKDPSPQLQRAEEEDNAAHADTRHHQKRHPYHYYPQDRAPEGRISLEPRPRHDSGHEAHQPPQHLETTKVKVEYPQEEAHTTSMSRHDNPPSSAYGSGQSRLLSRPVSGSPHQELEAAIVPRKKSRQRSNSRPAASGRGNSSTQSPGRIQSPSAHDTHSLVHAAMSPGDISMERSTTTSEPLDEPEGDDELSIKRFKNTLAARRSRAKKVMILEAERTRAKDLEHANWELQKRVLVLETEQVHLKAANETQRLHISHLEAELAHALEKIKERET